MINHQYDIHTVIARKRQKETEKITFINPHQIEDIDSLCGGIRENIKGLVIKIEEEDYQVEFVKKEFGIIIEIKRKDGKIPLGHMKIIKHHGCTELIGSTGFPNTGIRKLLLHILGQEPIRTAIENNKKQIT